MYSPVAPALWLTLALTHTQVAASLMNLVGTCALYFAFLRVSRVLHQRTLRSVMASPIAFFETTPTGRVLNRFSREMQVLDVVISGNARGVLVFILRLGASLYFIIAGSSPYLLLLLLPLSGFYYTTQKYYRASARELQRLNSISKSPLYAAFNEALSGCATIQAMGASERFAEKQNERFDHNLKAGFMMEAVGLWLGTRLQYLSSVCLLYTSPSPRDRQKSRMPSSA